MKPWNKKACQLRLARDTALLDGHNRKFSVTRRVPTLSGGPEWAVFEGGSGPGAEVVAHFFSETDARIYALWRESQNR